MASFRKRNGLWQAQVRSIHAGATSKSFHRKSDAERWATQHLSGTFKTLMTSGLLLAAVLAMVLNLIPPEEVHEA